MKTIRMLDKENTIRRVEDDVADRLVRELKAIYVPKSVYKQEKKTKAIKIESKSKPQKPSRKKKMKAETA